MADPSRYEGISTAESAHRTCSAPASRSVYTATDRMPSAESVRMIRTAISPRLAIRTAENIGSHPEDAVADRLQRCVGGGGQRQTTCYSCGGYGHMSRDCTQGQKSSRDRKAHV